MAVYDGAAEWYDRVWGARRDYRTDAATIDRLIRDHTPDAQRVLDVGCATGEHLRHLRDRYVCTGIDVSARLLEVAGAKLGDGVALHEADMATLDLGRTFDAITCLWGTIAYARTPRRLHAVAARMAAHLDATGTVIVEPWLTPDTFDDHGMVTVTVDEDRDPVLTVIAATRRRGSVAELQRLYVAATPSGIRTVEEHHELGLFTEQQYREAFEAAGFAVEWQPDGLTDRGLLVGRR